MSDTVKIPKSDSNPTLHKGTGTPYLAIFDGGKSAIIDPLNNLPIGVFVTSFQYDYEEGKEDSGRIIIETNNTNLISLKSLQYMMPLFLQWGWIYPDSTSKSSPLKKVLIVGHDVNFTPSGVRIQIDFADCSVLLKNMPPDFTKQAKGLEQYLISCLRGIPTGITFIDYDITKEVRDRVVAKRVTPSGDVVGNNINPDEYQEYLVMYKDFGTGPGQAIYPFFQGEFVPQVYYVSQTPYMSDPDQVGVKFLEATPENEKLTQELPNDYKLVDVVQHKATNVLLVGTAKNRFQQINQLANRLKKGPYYINGSGGKLRVENQKLNKPVSKVYTFAGGNGELLEFTVKSKFTKSSVEIGKASDIDPNDKKVKTTTTQIGIDQNMEQPDMYMHWWSSWGNPANPTTGFDMRYPYSRNPEDRYSNYPVFKDNGVMTPLIVEQAQKAAIQEIRNQVREEEARIAERESITYDSKEDAMIATQANLQLSKEEYKKFIESLKEGYNKKLGASSGEEIAESVQYQSNISNFTVTRKVIIKKQVNPATYDPLRTTNKVAGSQGETYTIYGPGSPTEQWKRGYDYLSHKQGVTILDKGSNDKGEFKTITIGEEVELEIPVNGARELANDYTEYSDLFMGNDIMETVRNQLTAKAIFVGDPFLEKSMNLEIQNVSDKYSGVWYIKSVSHRFDAGSGYLCDVNFIKKNVVVSKNIIKASTALLDAMARVNKVANDVYESTGQDRISILYDKLEEFANEHPGYSVLGVYNENKDQIDVYKSETDFKIMTKESGGKIDTNNISEKGVLIGSIKSSNDQ